MQQRNINSLQILRAFAAISVVVTHSGVTIPHVNIGDFGVLGVDLFFVLSGFLMTYTFKTSRVGTEFLKSRVLRIYPIYLVVSMPMILSSFMSWDDSVKLSNLFHNITLIPPLHDSYDRANYVNWTLAYEMYFYILFALSSFIFKEKIKSSIACSTIIIVIMMIIKSNYEIGYVGWLDSSAINILGNTIVLDFVVGALWGCVYNYITIKPNKVLSYSLCASIAVLSVYLIGHNMKGGLEYQSTLFFNSSIPAFFILFILSITNCGESKTEKALIYLGEASYAIYLTHLYIFSLPNVGPLGYFFRFLIAKLHITNGYLSSIILMTIAIVIGIFTHEVIEKALNKKLTHKNKTAPALSKNLNTSAS